MGNGNTADVVWLGFAKAFDSVAHGFLLTKLESFGPCENIVRCIRSRCSSLSPFITYSFSPILLTLCRLACLAGSCYCWCCGFCCCCSNSSSSQYESLKFGIGSSLMLVLPFSSKHIQALILFQYLRTLPKKDDPLLPTSSLPFLYVYTVRLLTHVHCKPTHFLFHSFIATMSYSP